MAAARTRAMYIRRVNPIDFSFRVRSAEASRSFCPALLLPCVPCALCPLPCPLCARALLALRLRRARRIRALDALECRAPVRHALEGAGELRLGVGHASLLDEQLAVQLERRLDR